MKQPPVTWFFHVFILLSLATSIIAQEVEDESEYSYVPGSANGPENWGNIKEEWVTCKTGQNQSPINLRQLKVEKIPRSQDIIKFYRPSPTILKNRGQDIALEWNDKMNKIRINCTDYILRNFHWHSPSEHKINGVRFALELHMVHQSAENKTAVIGLVYNFGTPDPFLSKLAGKIEQISDSRREVDAGIIDPADIKMIGNMYYRYIGSLTTPPCTEGVIWTVNKQVGTVSIEQVALLRKALNNDAKGNNARPLQPINGRKVHLYFTRNCFGETLIRKSFGRYFLKYFNMM